MPEQRAQAWDVLMRTAVVLAAVAAVLSVVVGGLRKDDGSTTRPGPTTGPDTRPDTAQDTPPDTAPDTPPVEDETTGGERTIEHVRPITGFAVNCHHISDLPLYVAAVDRIADLGANSLIVVTPWYQRHADSEEIRHLPTRGPTRDQLLAILGRAREHDLHTTLLPIVLIERPGDDDWRGKIRPEDWDAWWNSYNAFIDYFVAIAVEAEVDLFSVGSELNSTERQTGRWVELIERVRDAYGGQITYSANWDRYHRVTIWEFVDVMSVSSYFELERDRPGASRDDIVAAWAPIRDDLVAAAEAVGKPLILSEVGYPSLPWANAHPWNYVADRGQRADHVQQARCYQAFFEAWSPQFTDPDSPAAGFYCYRWDPYQDGDEYDTGYGVVGKPAHEIIRHAFARIRAHGTPE